MPLFNFRRAGTSSAAGAAASPADSVEVVRKRAKHRLIGASVLVLAGVVGFPLLFDTQPRPIAVDIPIEIPGKNTVKPLVMPAKPEAAKSEAAKPAASANLPPADPASATSAAVPPAAMAAPGKVASAAGPGAKEEIFKGKRAAAPVPSTQPAIEKEAPVAHAGPKNTAADDGARARALLEDQGTKTAAAAGAAAAGESRIVVQVGAFADAGKAKEARVKLEKAGFKTYTQVAQTPAGKRTRVRVGPFATRAEAENAAGKIKSLDLPAAILTL